MRDGGRRVIAADNDPEILELIVSDLRAEGHDVIAFALGGEEAVALCLEHQPDVLVVDYRMPPGPNGLDVAERLRAEAPNVAIVLYTNYRGHDLRTRAEKLGVTHLLKGNIRALRREVGRVGLV